MCRVLGANDWLEDARFRTNADRMKNLGALTEVMNARLKSRKVDELIKTLEAEGVPCGRINSIAEVAADPQALAREMVVELEHPRAGRTRALGLPVKLSRTPGKVSRPAPLLGQHTREVLEEFGFSRAEIDALVQSGAAVAG
jgi:crotonobetainyl-CoA:carnitine CoA-transferase CaiB-like acyl-CoA transferase